MNKRMIEKIIGDIAAVATLLTMVRQSDTKEMNPASVTAALFVRIEFFATNNREVPN